VDKDFEWLSQHSDVTKFKCVDEAPINYLKSIIQSNISDDKPKSVQILVDKSEPKVNGFTNVEELNNADIDIELESQIQYIREIIPDLGPGFVQKCLEYFHLDNEKVLNAILEDNLPPELSNIDRNLQKVPKIPPKEKENEVKNENLVQSTSSASEILIPKIIDERHNVYNNDEFDIYRNKNIDLSRIHKGKKDRITPKLDAITKEKIIAIHNKRLEDEENEEFSNYNDEYDDTYEDDTKVDLISDKLLDELVSQQSVKVYSNNNDNKEQTFNPRKWRHN
jgi:activating signal cointegrator complex subunit 2